VELVNDFTVNATIDEAWAVLTDVERIAPCLPGAQLQEVEGDVYRGVVKVKVGPIVAQFKGEAHFIERDDDHHRAVLKAKGRDTAGKGNADAMIVAQLEPVTASSTRCTVTTDLNITGKVAQFGRGALADVSTKLLHQFVEQLESTVLADHIAHVAHVAATAPTADTPPAPAGAELAPPSGEPASEAPAVRKIEHRAAAPVDLIDAAGAPLAKRLLPLLAVLMAFMFWRHRRRRRRHAAS